MNNYWNTKGVFSELCHATADAKIV